MMENKKLKIAIDIDEVVAEFMKAFLRYHNKKNGSSFSVEDLESYYLWESPVHKSREETFSEVNEFQDSDDFDKIEFVEAAREIIQKLSEKYSIFFITARPPEIKDKTRAFLEKNLPGLDFELIHSGEVYGGKSKSYICAQEGINIIIEDNPHYSWGCAENGMKVFLIEKPWNKNYRSHENIFNVKGWNEILEELNEY